MTKIVSFGFRFVNLHTEGINLHYKNVGKLVVCNEYKNLTQILQMVASISPFVFANRIIFFSQDKGIIPVCFHK